MDDDEIRFTITEAIGENTSFDPPRKCVHSKNGPICPSCERHNSPQFCGKDGILSCQHCGVRSGFMAGPFDGGFVWSTWPLIEGESEEA